MCVSPTFFFLFYTKVYKAVSSIGAYPRDGDSKWLIHALGVGRVQKIPQCAFAEEGTA